MSNERQRQASTLVVVARDNLKTDRNKRLPFAIKKKKEKKVLSGRPCRSNSMSWTLPQWTNEEMKLKMMGDDWLNYCGHTCRES